MAFCPSCGAPIQGRFCARCGASVDAGTQMPPGQQQTPHTAPPYSEQGTYGQPGYPPPSAQAGGLDENIASALCYLLGVITGILFLFLEPYNRNRTVRFHAFQSIFLFGALIVLQIVLTIFRVILVSILPYGLWFVVNLLSGLISLGTLGLWLFMMYKAYNREKFKLPVIGDLAEKQANQP